jgi:hypothetical protein
MFSEHERLIELEGLFSQRTRFNHQLNQAIAQRQTMSHKKKTLTEQLEQANVDLNRLDKLTFIRICLDIIGSRRENLSKNQKDIYRAEVQYKILEASLQLIDQEIEGYHDKINHITAYEQAHKELLELKAQYVKTSDNTYLKLESLDESINQSKLIIKEINEVNHGTNQLSQALELLNKLLEQINNWGSIDLLGGGVFTSMMKQTKLQQAEDQIKSIHYYANRLQRELKDMDVNYTMSLDINEFIMFSDYFFEHLFDDLMEQNRVKAASLTVLDCQQQCHYVKELLARQKNTKLSEIKDLMNIRTHIING